MTKLQRLCFLLIGALNFFVFTVMNLLSWSRARADFYKPSEIQFDHSGYSWGWPFDMYNNYTGFPSNEVGFGPGLIFNIFIFLVTTSLIAVLTIYLIEQITLTRRRQEG